MPDPDNAGIDDQRYSNLSVSVRAPGILNGIFNRLLSIDSVSLLLGVTVLFLAFAGVELSRRVGNALLHGDGQDTTLAWAQGLTSRTSDIPAIISGAIPSSDTKHILDDASQQGDIYGFRIWDKAGHLVFGSERTSPPWMRSIPDNDRAQRIAGCLYSGAALTESHARQLPDDPAYFAISYLPIRQNGAVVGLFEVYLNQTADHALYQGSLHLTEGIIAIAVLLSGGLPVVIVHRRMLACRESQSRVAFLAEHDGLTGIANRNCLARKEKGAVAWNRRNKSCMAVLLIDLDRFKDINDSFGHSIGDQLLQALAGRLKSTIRAADTVARFGGDEFVILQVGMAQPGGAVSLAGRLTKTLSEPYDIGGLKVVCGVSIGVAIMPLDSDEWESLLSCADAALYKAKASGRGSVCFYQPGMDAALRERRLLEDGLRRALESKTFHLAYQPLFSFRDHTLLGFEALLRWPEAWASRSPEAFIPVAEESGLIVPVGSWVLETACAAAAAWTKPLQVAVNLSPVQFRRGDIVSAVEHALRSSGLDPARLELEVTESLLLHDTDKVVIQLLRLRALGVSIAMDDFGTGYSSLGYLWKFPFDNLKIDRSFVAQMDVDAKAEAIVKSIISLGKALRITITAEGIETPVQAQALDAAGCDRAQGYWFGRPLPSAEASALISSESPPAAETSAQSVASEKNIPELVPGN